MHKTEEVVFPLPGIDLSSLLFSLQKGEEKAFVQVFRLYYGALVNYAGRMVRDEEMANDVVQDAFCRLYDHRQEIKQGFALKAWLYRTVYNACIDLIRRQKIAEEYANAKMLDFYFSRILQSPEAELALQDKDIARAVEEAIQQLPERCREIFRLSKFEGLSNKQIAEQLHISVKTVEAQMTTALTRLRKELEWLLLLIFSINF